MLHGRVSQSNRERQVSQEDQAQELIRNSAGRHDDDYY